jgi:beta-N-acetylhexosaminidase
MKSLECLAARMFGFGFDGPELTAEGRKLLDRGAGAVILFKRNVENPRQFAGLCAQVKNHVDRPVPIGVDQEGGRVMRLREPFTIVPSMRAVGKVADEALAKQIGQVLARELRAVNVDIDFAPCMDVDTNPANPVIADRSLGTTPEVVSRLGCAIIEGIQSEGVAACAKHFPGHGDTALDSHHALPRLPHAMERLEAVELPPFHAAIKAGVASIMTNHVIFEPLDREFPTTMSRACLDGILRDRMGFDGVVFSDDMEMKAIASHFGIEQAIIRGANAGVDLFWISHHAELVHQAIDFLIKAVERGEVRRERVEQANRRMEALNRRYCRPAVEFDPSAIGCPEHQAIVDRVKKLVDQSLLGTGIDPTDFMKLQPR